MGMGMGCRDWPDDVSLAQLIGIGSEDTTLNRTNPDTSSTSLLGELIGHEHTGTLVLQLSSVYIT